MGEFVQTPKRVAAPRGIAVCTLSKVQLQGLVTIARPKDADHAIGLPRIYLDPRDSLIAAADARSMIWLRGHFRALTEAFSLSCGACREALELAPESSTPIEIAVREHHVGSRREITLSVGSEVVVDLECPAPYPQPRGVLGPRPTPDRVEFDADELIRLCLAIQEVSGRRDPTLYVMPRGRAPAFLVSAVSEVMGFAMPAGIGPGQPGISPLAHTDAEFESAARWARQTLREFDIREPVRALARVIAEVSHKSGRRRATSSPPNRDSLDEASHSG
jgi:hypothetical protein